MVWAMTRQNNARPGHVERLKSDASSESESSSNRTVEDRLKTHKEDNTRQAQQVQRKLSVEENQQIDEECLQRFIKLNVRLMTEDHVSVIPRWIRRFNRNELFFVSRRKVWLEHCLSRPMLLCLIRMFLIH